MLISAWIIIQKKSCTDEGQDNTSKINKSLDVSDCDITNTTLEENISDNNDTINVSENDNPSDSSDVDESSENDEIIKFNSLLLEEKCEGSGFLSAILVNSFNFGKIKSVESAICISRNNNEYDITFSDENNKIYHIHSLNGVIQNIEEIN